MDTPTWPELVFLMVHGPDRTMRGRIRHRDGEEPRAFAYASIEGDPPPPFVHGSSDVIDAWRHGDHLRVADPGGQVRMISDGTTAWTFSTDGEPPEESPARHVEFGMSGTDLLVRTDAERWLGDDFTRPTGLPVATTFLGRDAWEVELAPPDRKPHPMQLVIDAETGMQLQQRNDAFGWVSEWISLTVGEDLDPALFEWTGPVVTWEQQREQAGRQVAAERAQRAQWAIDNLGTQQLAITVEVVLEVHHVEADGSLHASLGPIGSLARRPHSDRPWGEADRRVEEGRTHRWSDSEWDWALQVWESRLTPSALAAVQAQLRP